MENSIGLEGLPRYTANEAPEGVGSQELGKSAFLTLLTTQLRNQDPSSPVKNEDFVAQLAQFSSLEALVGMQESLDAVYAGIASMNNASMSSLLGRVVVAVGDTFTMDEPGGMELQFEASGSYDGASLTVFDEEGRVVSTADLPPGGVGEGSFQWDGLDQSGAELPPGEYRFSLSPVGDEPPEMQELIVGEITEMDYSGGVPLPSMNGVVVELNAILRLTSAD